MWPVVSRVSLVLDEDEAKLMSTVPVFWPRTLRAGPSLALTAAEVAYIFQCFVVCRGLKVSNPMTYILSLIGTKRIQRRLPWKTTRFGGLVAFFCRRRSALVEYV